MKLLIFYLTDNNRHYSFAPFLQLINQSTCKNEWQLMVLTHTDDSSFYESELKNVNIQSVVIQVNPHNNYLVKVTHAIQYASQHTIPFMMKCDNDIFLKAQTLDYMVSNLELLNDSAHLTLGPVLTSGIPGVEYFCEQFLDPDAHQEINSLFLKTRFYDRDGANYTPLNKYTIESQTWDKHAYFNAVTQMQHHYKGMHPIRINEESLEYLNNYIIQNKERFFQDYPLDIIRDDNSPYLCNSIFCIKTDTYKKVFYDNSLYVDGFEEVPVNKYRWNHNMNHLFVKNGFAVHMYYNWKNNHNNSEQQFCNKLFSKS